MMDSDGTGLMTEQNHRLQEMINTLKEHEYRITPQRLAVLGILASSKAHPSVEQIYARVKEDFPTTSLATVYKTLTVLKSLGQVLEIGFGEGSNRYDGYNPHPHPHLICLRCKRITDPELSSLAELTDELSRATGFTIQSHRLDFFGICPDCQKKLS